MRLGSLVMVQSVHLPPAGREVKVITIRHHKMFLWGVADIKLVFWIALLSNLNGIVSNRYKSNVSHNIWFRSSNKQCNGKIWTSYVHIMLIMTIIVYLAYVHQTLNSLIMHCKSFSTGSYLEGNQSMKSIWKLNKIFTKKVMII